MIACRVCGDEKEKSEFESIPYFTKWKKHKVFWCRDCQKLYIQMRKDKERLEKFVKDDTKFTVSFE